MIKMSYHPDLATLNQFEKLILALGRWPQFFTISLAISDTEISGGFCQGNLLRGIDILCNVCSGTLTFGMISSFASLILCQVNINSKVNVPEPVGL